MAKQEPFPLKYQPIENAKSDELYIESSKYLDDSPCGYLREGEPGDTGFWMEMESMEDHFCHYPDSDQEMMELILNHVPVVVNYTSERLDSEGFEAARREIFEIMKDAWETKKDSKIWLESVSRVLERMGGKLGFAAFEGEEEEEAS
ncbi:MAG: hypothetical protein ACXWPM_07975 [Bdellovibrionota bacterium]